MMLPLNFETLSQADQADLLSMEGVFLRTTQRGALLVDSYELNSFLVDVYYDAYTCKAVKVKSYYPRLQRPPIYQMHLPQLSIRCGA